MAETRKPRANPKHAPRLGAQSSPRRAGRRWLGSFRVGGRTLLASVILATTAGMVVGISLHGSKPRTSYEEASTVTPNDTSVVDPPHSKKVAVPSKSAPSPHQPLPPPETAARIAAPAAPPDKDPDDTPLWLRNAVPMPTGAANKPLVAIVIDDMGVDRRHSRRMLTLPKPLTMSYLTYARHLSEQTAAARAAGHELMMHMPMQPQGDADPGPGALVLSMTPQETGARARKMLSLMSDMVGVNNHMGSLFTENAAHMRPVLAAIRDKGLFWVDSRTTAHSVGPQLADELGVVHIERQVFLDHEENDAFVEHQLARVEAIARRRGYAIAIGHPKDVTYRHLKEWLPSLAEKGLALAPVSAVVRRRMAATKAAAAAAVALRPSRPAPRPNGTPGQQSAPH